MAAGLPSYSPEGGGCPFPPQLLMAAKAFGVLVCSEISVFLVLHLLVCYSPSYENNGNINLAHLRWPTFQVRCFVRLGNLNKSCIILDVAFMKQGMGTQSGGLESWPDLEQVT